MKRPARAKRRTIDRTVDEISQHSVPRRFTVWARGILAGLLVITAMPVWAADKSASIKRDGDVTTVTLPDSVVLTYAGSQPNSGRDARHAACQPGGIRGGVDCGIVKPLSGSSGSAANQRQVGATLTLPLTPRLQYRDNQPHLTLTVGTPVFNASGVDSETETKLRREAAMVKIRLSRWRHSLTRTQQTILLRDRALQLPITDPFSGLALFAAPNLKARWEFTPTELRYVVKNGDSTLKKALGAAEGWLP